jgi:hypothetical protein
MTKTILQFIGVLAFMGLLSCGGSSEGSIIDSNASGSDSTSAEKQPAEKEIKKAVCIYNGSGVYKEPERENWKASLKLGEVVTFLGESQTTKKGEKETTCHKVKLIDDKEGWVADWAIIIDGKAAALQEDSPVYDRPSIVNKSNQSLKKMDVVGIINTKENFSNIQIANSWKKGWVKTSSLTTDEDDVAVAVFAKLGIKTSIEETSSEELQEFLDELEIDDSQFIEYIRGLIEGDVGDYDEIDESMIEEDMP